MQWTLGALAHRWPALVAAACALAVSLPGALSHAMWGDEVASARVLAEENVSDVVGRVRVAESTPPAWYLGAWGSTWLDNAVTGGVLLDPVERLRLLSVLFAAATAALTAMWARRLLEDSLAAVLAGTLVALGTSSSAYAEQLRAYAALALLALVFGMLLARVAASPTRTSGLALAVCTALAMLTHYFVVFTVVAGVAWLWIARPRPRGRVHATCALVVGLVAVLPWLESFLEQRGRARYAWIGPFDAGSVASLPGSLFFGTDGVLYGAARGVLTGALFVGAFVVARRAQGSLVVFLCFGPLALAAVTWLVGEPVLNERNLLTIAPYAALLASASLLAAPRRAVTPLAVAGMACVVLGAAYTQATLGRTAYDRVAGSLVALGWKNSDPIAVGSPTGETSLRSAISWYLPGHPTLVREPRPGACSVRFVVGHSSTLGQGLERGSDVASMHTVAAFDHPHRGRRSGWIVIMRLREPIAAGQPLPGVVLRVRGDTRSCAGTTELTPRAAAP